MSTRQTVSPRRYQTDRPRVLPEHFRILAFDLIDGVESEIDVSTNGLLAQQLARELAKLFAPAVITSVLTNDSFCWYNSSPDYPNSNKLYWP